MKRITAIGLIVVLLAVLAGCGGGGGKGSANAVSSDEAKNAFLVGFVSVFSASIGLAFGQEVPGATLDEETQALTLTDFDLTELTGGEEDFPYTSVSGTAEDADGAMAVDLTLKGGPVETISFTITPEQMQSEAGFTVTVTANGEEMDLEIVPEDLQGE